MPRFHTIQCSTNKKIEAPVSSTLKVYTAASLTFDNIFQVLLSSLADAPEKHLFVINIESNRLEVSSHTYA